MRQAGPSPAPSKVALALADFRWRSREPAPQPFRDRIYSMPETVQTKPSSQRFAGAGGVKTLNHMGCWHRPKPLSAPVPFGLAVVWIQCEGHCTEPDQKLCINLLHGVPVGLAKYRAVETSTLPGFGQQEFTCSKNRLLYCMLTFYINLWVKKSNRI